jgi:hypothetical protein
MSIKLLLFLFTFLFFPKKYYFTVNIETFCKAIEQKVKIVNEKKQKMLGEEEKSLIFFVMTLQGLMYNNNQVKQDLKNALNKQTIGTSMEFLKDFLIKFCQEINCDPRILLTQYNFKDSFKKQITDSKNRKPPIQFNNGAIWRKYQIILLKILIADFFNVDVNVPIEDNSIAFYTHPFGIVSQILVLSKQNLDEDKQKNKINNFIDDYLVKFAIDWKAIGDDSISVNNQELIPMDNDTFLELFKESSVDLSHVKIPDKPTEILSIPNQQQQQKWYKKKKIVIPSLGICVSLLSVSSIFFGDKNKKTKNPKNLTKILKKKIKILTAQKEKLQQQNQQPINNYSS